MKMKAMTSVSRSKNSSTKLRDSMSSRISVVSVASVGSGLRPEPSGGGKGSLRYRITRACFSASALLLLTVTVWGQSWGGGNCKDVEYCEVRGDLGNCELDFAWYDCDGRRKYTPRTCRDGETRQNCMCTCYSDGYEIFYWDVGRETFIDDQWWCLRSCPIGGWEYALGAVRKPRCHKILSKGDEGEG
jgi:hypothetical protein